MGTRTTVGLIAPVVAAAGLTIALDAVPDFIPPSYQGAWRGLGLFLIFIAIVMFVWLLRSRASESVNERNTKDSAEVTMGTGGTAKIRDFSSDTGRRFFEGGDNTKLDAEGVRLVKGQNQK